MVMNTSCKFEKPTYNTLASREVTRKSLHTAAATVAVAGAADGYNYYILIQDNFVIALGIEIQNLKSMNNVDINQNNHSFVSVSCNYD